MKPHVLVWDWNGTLFHDFDSVVAALNESLAGELATPITPDLYRAYFRAPMKTFTEFLVGRGLSDCEFAHIDRLFHNAYDQRISNSDLAPSAREALQTAEMAGYVQVIVSMWNHDRLLELVDAFGIGEHFDIISGDESGGRRDKAGRIKSCFNALPANTSDGTIIGDITKDARVARQVGCRCILVAENSSQTIDTLEMEAPVVATVRDAVELVHLSATY